MRLGHYEKCARANERAARLPPVAQVQPLLTSPLLSVRKPILLRCSLRAAASWLTPYHLGSLLKLLALSAGLSVAQPGKLAVVCAHGEQQV